MFSELLKHIEHVQSTAAGRRVTPDIAVVAVDLQHDFCSAKGLAWKNVENKGRLRLALQSTEQLLTEARQSEVPCLFVRSFFDAKYKLRPLRRKHAELGIKDEICKENTWGAEFCGPLPGPDDLVITKHTDDAFLYTFLGPALRSLRADTVILIGVFSEMCIFQTALSAFRRGFEVVVPEVCVAGMMEQCANKALSDMRASGILLVSPADLGNVRRMRVASTTRAAPVEAAQEGTKLLPGFDQIIGKRRAT